MKKVTLRTALPDQFEWSNYQIKY